MNISDRTALVKRIALDVGFDRCGVAKAAPIGRAGYLREWLAAGRHGSMGYLQRHFEKRVDSRQLLPGANTVIVVALSYNQAQRNDTTVAPTPPQAVLGRVAMYAWGEDYHAVMKQELETLLARIRSALPPEEQNFLAKICVDTSPIVEREAAAAAGIGWIGKNTLVLHPELGSFFFLGEVITSLVLDADEPMPDHCGTCTACLDACPTQAFVAPYQMDAARCISYLTIEHRGPVEPEFHHDMSNWVFGCDVCQDVCPHNRHALSATDQRLTRTVVGPSLDLGEVQTWDDETYERNVTGTAVERATLAMLKRNASIVSRNVTGAKENPSAEA